MGTVPQDRTTLAADALWQVERVHWHRTAAQWGPVHRAPSRRWVLPATGTTQWRGASQATGQASLLVDGLTAFCLADAEDYQLKPEFEEVERNYVVVSRTSADAGAGGGEEAPRAQVPPVRAWLLPPAVLYRLRLHWRELERGGSPRATVDLLPHLLRQALPQPDPREPRRHVQCTRHLLLAEPGTALTLHELAEEARSSAFHLARSFRQATGLSLHRYRLHLRLALALARLEAGERDLAGLAHELGFSSHSHFGAVFRGEIGAAPAQVRAALAH